MQRDDRLAIMIIGYEHSTPWGVFRMLLSGGRWTLFCEEEKLSDYPTAFDALNGPERPTARLYASERARYIADGPSGSVERLGGDRELRG